MKAMKFTEVYRAEIVELPRPVPQTNDIKTMICFD